MLKYFIPHNFIWVFYYVNQNEVNFEKFCFFSLKERYFILAEEKILNMRHILPNGSTIHLSHLPRQLFQQTKSIIDGQTMQSNGISTFFQQCLPFLHASG
jgi:hypothetical protein